MKTTLLWVFRKALYVTAGSALGAGLAYVTGHPDLNSWTIAGATSALGSAVIGDLRRAFLPTWFQAK
jgi:hypothetical protein